MTQRQVTNLHPWRFSRLGKAIVDAIQQWWQFHFEQVAGYRGPVQAAFPSNTNILSYCISKNKEYSCKNLAVMLNVLLDSMHFIFWNDQTSGTAVGVEVLFAFEVPWPSFPLSLQTKNSKPNQNWEVVKKKKSSQKPLLAIGHVQVFINNYKIQSLGSDLILADEALWAIY